MKRGLPVAIGYDGSEYAGLALTWGLDLAARTGTAARVVVAAPSPGQVPPRALAEEEAFVHHVAARARDVVAASAAPDSVVIVEHGETVAVLLRTALDASTVVVGSVGHGRIAGAWSGSVSTHLVGHASCPVFVVRPAHDPGAHQVLVGIDGTPASERALVLAASRAELTGEEVLAVHACSDPNPFRGDLGKLAQDVDSSGLESFERHAAELVAGVAGEHPDLQLRSAVVVGAPGEVLSRLSASSSLVVVGSRGRKPGRELLLGSVAHDVVHRAQCPVLVTP